MLDQCSRFQMACLGTGGVGKTSIIKQYLYGKHSQDYSMTVEDTFIQNYNINGNNKRIDFIDTAGHFFFPAMQKIYIARAVGFILVYSVSDARSFEIVKIIWEQIKSARQDILSIPCVIVGNKVDIENNREVETFDALEWAYNENLGGCFVEVSAKTDNGIKNVFDILLEQLGNTRAHQTGPFRMRTTSFTRQPAEVDFTSKKMRKNAKKQLKYDIVSPSSKCFQDLMFDNYREKKIYRLITQKRQDSITKNDKQRKCYHRSRSDTWAHVVKKERKSSVKVIRSKSISAEDTYSVRQSKVASNIRHTNLLDCHDETCVEADQYDVKNKSADKRSNFIVKRILKFYFKILGKTTY
ncbi:unnamed protein product [Mytilus coruscus]|uniref:GTP-binding protein Di-Ras2 n=1 Tax=Mytilus coruscus TaxID=42192 RepID=A0A6J8EUB2_MYTCO|nr:unnamed protein product [Mytilus coruscus]